MDFVKGKWCADVSAGAGVESKDKGSSCLLGHGILGLVPEGYPWEVRTKQYCEVGQSFILSRDRSGLRKFSQQEKEGKVVSEDA